MATLYELTEDFRTLLEMADDPDVDPQALVDTMDSIEGEIEDKADGYARVLAQLDADAEAAEKQAKRLAERAKAIRSNMDRMKERLKTAMIETGKTKFKTELFSFSVRNNGGKQPLVYTVNPADLPKEFRREKVTYSPDDDVIRRYLDNGNTSDFFHYGERGQNLQIK